MRCHRGELSLLYGQITIPNAICFSPDGTIGYFADTGKNTLFRVDLDAATGLPVGEPSRAGSPGGVAAASTARWSMPTG